MMSFGFEMTLIQELRTEFQNNISRMVLFDVSEGGQRV